MLNSFICSTKEIIVNIFWEADLSTRSEQYQDKMVCFPPMRLKLMNRNINKINNQTSQNFIIHSRIQLSFYYHSHDGRDQSVQIAQPNSAFSYHIVALWGLDRTDRFLNLMIGSVSVNENKNHIRLKTEIKIQLLYLLPSIDCLCSETRVVPD